jgi:phosphoribosylanthranilate isomerase
MIKGVKICGVSDLETLKYIINHPYPPQFIGFITNYKKSKRFVEFNTLEKLTGFKNNKVSFVSVLVNPDDNILEKIKDLQLDYYQLYDVDPERTKLIKNKYNKKIISSIMIQNKENIENYKLYQNISDIILFDGKGYEKSIGFDHKLLDNIPNHITKMIAGNIKIDNIPVIKNKDYIIDLSGSLENEEGKKDLHKINYFLNKIKQYETKKKNTTNRST